MIFDDYVRLARRNVVVLLVLVLLGLGGGLAASLLQTPKYIATTTVYVSTQQATSLSDLGAGSQLAQGLVRGYAQVIPEEIILGPVIASLQLKESSLALGATVSVSNPLDTSVLQISVVNRSPRDAARIANAIGQSLASKVSVLTPPTADTVSPVRIITTQPATAPTSPSSPNTPVNTAVGGVVGLLLAIFVALVRNAFRQRARQSAAVAPVPVDRAITGSNRVVGPLPPSPRPAPEPAPAREPAPASTSDQIPTSSEAVAIDADASQPPTAPVTVPGSE